MAASKSVFGQIERKAIGVVELEGGLAGELAAFAETRSLIVENGETTRQRGAEARFFGAQRIDD
jgi:hypothetical protein